MSKHGIIGRIMQLARADISAVVGSAADPGKALDQLLWLYEAGVVEAEQEIAGLADSQQTIRDDQAQDARAAARWVQKAVAASDKADELRAAGAAADADSFDDLARTALARLLTAQSDVAIAQHMIDAQAEWLDKLADGLGQLEARLAELERERDRRTAGRGAGPARPGAAYSADRADVMDPASAVTWFEHIVRQAEARLHDCAGQRPQDGVGQPADAGDQAEIESRLRELKAGRAMASATARAHEQANLSF